MQIADARCQRRGTLHHFIERIAAVAAGDALGHVFSKAVKSAPDLRHRLLGALAHGLAGSAALRGMTNVGVHVIQRALRQYLGAAISCMSAMRGFADRADQRDACERISVR